jgi:hypothetical protein
MFQTSSMVRSRGVTSFSNGANPFNVWRKPTDLSTLSSSRTAMTSQGGGQRRMPLIQVVIVLIVVGVLLWLVNRFIPMQVTIKSILNAVVVICVVLWLLNIFGLFSSFAHIRVGNG